MYAFSVTPIDFFRPKEIALFLKEAGPFILPPFLDFATIIGK
jgi:hypothetical protein